VIAEQKDKQRINDEITAKEVRLISSEGEQLGVVSLKEALEISIKDGLDLVEVSPGAKPPVCRVMDYGKFLYHKEKKAREAKKKQKVVEIKELKFGPKIGDHDYSYRIKRMREFLEKGDKVKVTIRFRGREIAHKELGYQLMDRIYENIKDLGSGEKKIKFEGRNMRMLITPASKK
jgi:translation initiation factor IF-3